MKKLIFSCLALVFLCSATVNAQGLLDKIDRTLDKADRASRTADRSKSTGDKLTGFLKKKNKDTETKAENQTVIRVSGIDFTALKKLNGRIQTCKSVAQTQTKFSSAASTITVTHSGTTEELFDLLSKSADDVFNDKNLDEMGNGEIAINLKKK